MGTSSESKLDVQDEDVVKEETFVETVFGSITPSNRQDISLIVSDVSKVFFGKTFLLDVSLMCRGAKRVFPEVSFSIHDKEVFGLLGPNGAGKTTLISIMTGKLNPNQGNLKIFGYTFVNSFTVKQLIGVVPQFDVFFDDMTVKEHLELVAHLHNVPRRERDRLVKDIAEQVGLSRDAFQHRAAKLSGGQKRRLTLGMALMSRPLLLFLDEPTVWLN